MTNFAPGMLVILKSGGPLMTVEKVYTAADGDPRVSCHWFTKDHKPLREKFRPEILEEYKTDDEGPIEPQFS